jgi:hypothetical protein
MYLLNAIKRVIIGEEILSDARSGCGWPEAVILVRGRIE